ncbi:hypothetical protein PQR01_00445 [Paraburkholderia rhynchosiae]|uniref:Uncharacterized protein n=1 Tax=Paraburkholderia rhynchosiae TaxID=487049 RepID=A0ACC7N2Z9_9BURK
MSAAIAAAGVGAAGAIGASLINSGGGSTTSSQTSTINPVMNGLLFGDTTHPGGFVNNSIANLEYTPQNASLAQFGNDANSYLGSGAALGGYANALNTANGMLNWSQQTPTMNSASMQAAGMNAAQMNAAQGSAAQINAPNQNGINLAPTYQNMLSGASGNNPYLTGQIQQGINQANDAYNNSMTNATRNLTQSVLPAINSGAVAAGGYGGSRQGVAQGNAIGQYGTALAQAGSQMGMNNQDAAANAQANTYMQGQSNALSALNNLSNQQYGVASQNASMQQGMNLANLQNQQQANLTNSGYQQQAGLANSGYQQQAGLTNAQLQEQTGQANLNSNLSTNSLNSANALGAMSQIGNLTGQVYNYGNAQNAYPYWQTQQVTNMLSPFTGLGGQTSQTTPYFTNPVGNAIGGATAGLGLYNAYQNASGAGNGASGLVGGTGALNIANASSDPIGSLYSTQGW